MPINGRLDLADLASVPGGLLRADAAESWGRVRAAVGLDLRPTSYADTYRPFEVQERIFRERYTTAYVTGIDPRLWLGMVWWRKPVYAAAAVPGTSNHGWGLAIDVTGLGGFSGATYARLAGAAGPHGWNNTAGRQIAEPWHWEYAPSTDTHPTSAQEDDDVDAETRNMIFHIGALLAETPVRTAQAVAGLPVSRVAGQPSTFLQDTVDGTSAALAIRAILDPDGNGKFDSPKVDVDEVALAAALAPLIPKAVVALSDDDLARVAKVAADESDRRARTRLGA